MSNLPPVPPASVAPDIRAALRDADYTASGVSSWLGPVAERALARGEPAPTRRLILGGSDLETLIQLFLLAEPVAEVDAEKALNGRGVSSGVLLRAERGVVRAALDLRPYGDDWWVASDLRPPGGAAPLEPDAVVGIGSASMTLVMATPRPTGIGTALDLGTGCGVQALHLAASGASVTATDLSDRALQMAALTAALSGMSFELLSGNLFAPVEDRVFDQVVANPPFVIGPSHYTYRDSEIPADGLTAAMVSQVASHLAVGGTATLLGSWLAVDGADWQERIRPWLPADCDALVLLREQLDPAEHVALWLADVDEPLEAEAPDGTAEAWLADLEEQSAEGVCYGLLLLRRLADGVEPYVVMLDLRDEVETPSGVRLSGWLDRVAALRATEAESLRVSKASGLRLVRTFESDEDGWGQIRATLTAPNALPARVDVNELVVAIVKECEPELPLEAVLQLVGAGTGSASLAEDALPAILALVEAGLLVPVS